MAKGIKTGGRKKGTRNKATSAKAAAVAASGLTPLDYMLGIMRDELAPVERRDEMAKAAGPYIHPKLAAIEHTGAGGGPIKTQELTPNEGARRVAFLLAKGMKEAQK